MKPLGGVRAVSLAVNVPGPVAAASLVQLGAEVTKVEPPGGDPLAVVLPQWYGELVNGQDVVALDLKDAAARDRLDELLVECDLLLTSSRPSALERLGVGWAGLHIRFPRLCQVAVVGHAAPDQERAGHDLTYLAEHGLIVPPALPPTMMADLVGAERAVSAALGVLLARERRHESGYVEVALSDGAEFLATPLRHGATAPGGPLRGGLPFYGIYEARDGWVAVAALEPHFQQRLTEGLALAELTHAALAGAFATRRASEWEGWARERDLPLVEVRAVGADS